MFVASCVSFDTAITGILVVATRGNVKHRYEGTPLCKEDMSIVHSDILET